MKTLLIPLLSFLIVSNTHAVTQSEITCVGGYKFAIINVNGTTMTHQLIPPVTCDESTLEEKIRKIEHKYATQALIYEKNAAIAVQNARIEIAEQAVEYEKRIHRLKKSCTDETKKDIKILNGDDPEYRDLQKDVEQDVEQDAIKHHKTIKRNDKDIQA